MIIALMAIALALRSDTTLATVRSLAAPPAVAEVLEAWTPDTAAAFCIADWSIEGDRLTLASLFPAAPAPTPCGGVPQLIQRGTCTPPTAEIMAALGMERPAWFVVHCGGPHFRIFERDSARPGRSAP